MTRYNIFISLYCIYPIFHQAAYKVDACAVGASLLPSVGVQIGTCIFEYKNDKNHELNKCKKLRLALY